MIFTFFLLMPVKMSLSILVLQATTKVANLQQQLVIILASKIFSNKKEIHMNLSYLTISEISKIFF